MNKNMNKLAKVMDKIAKHPKTDAAGLSELLLEAMPLITAEIKVIERGYSQADEIKEMRTFLAKEHRLIKYDMSRTTERKKRGGNRG
ncbi:hypothetical protein [Priestia taiwanensis]|uniref:Uncharacterized protein n=1 Tax=Priestia taiwanensis TaxID=1347902 RepID=A0A917ES27_9BACI|nr:hypothetical protein [Priestia taiwanensis]MBM7364589.1 hypothetical protein [Priestia taiwanensis]GGE80289.1 hypothetical protein GCM10007140_32300 [Priestia taiwanensis]